MVLLSSSTAWAQDGSVTTAPPASSVPVGKDGFRIDGNDKPALYKEYEYHREMPDEENVYWHLEGVEVVNGAPVRMYPDGSLDANKFQTLTIQWDDSATTRKLQLRRGYKDETEVLAELLVRGTSITNQIMYHGQAPNYTPKVHSTAIYTCAWNPVDPVTGTVSGEPHHFQMESNCSGNTGQLWAPCSSRPNFVWTIRYYTASGTFFQEQLCDFTSGDFSKMWIYFYSKIPYPYYATPIPGVFPYPGTVNNATTTGWHGNGNVFRWPDIVSGGTCGWSVTRTATPGDAITRIHMECTGYSCGWSLRPDNDAIDIYYLGLPPAPIALVNSTDPELCRSRTYQVETAGTIGAVGYAWAADNGARLLAIPGTGSGRMTLDLGNVPNSANSVTVTVQPSAGSQVCTGFPQVTSYTFQLQRPPANPVVLLPSDNCPSLTPKLIQVAALDATAQYRWRVTGTAGAYFVSPSGNSMTPPDGPGIIGLVTPRIGDATITVTAIGPQCRGTSAATTQVFNIGNILPAAPTLLVGRSGCISMQNNVTLSIQSPIPGLTYQIGRPFNAVNTTGRCGVGHHSYSRRCLQRSS